jgi:hypothetical protein
MKTGSYLDRQSAFAPGPGMYNPGGSPFKERSVGSSNGGAGFGTEKRAIGGVSKAA